MTTYSYVSDDETLVNSSTAGYQSNPSITTLSDGGWVVTWQSPDQGNGAGIYQQRYNSLGVAVSGEVNVTTQAWSDSPIISQLSDGGWIVTWHGDDGSNYRDVRQQRYNSDGTTNGSEVRVNGVTAGNQGWPSVTGLADGGWLVTWQSGNQASVSSGYDIYQQRYNANGTANGSEMLVNTTTSGPQATSVVTELSDGGWVVTWEGFDQNNANHIFQQRYNANGTRYGVETKVDGVDAGTEVSVTGLSSGGWVVTWTSGDGSGYGIHQQRYNADGSLHGTDQVVNTYTSGSQQTSSVVALTDGGWVVVWQSTGQDGDGTGVYAQVFNANGDKVGDEALINTFTTGYEGTPVVSALADGRFVVA